jgi:hypothetical protein
MTASLPWRFLNWAQAQHWQCISKLPEAPYPGSPSTAAVMHQLRSCLARAAQGSAPGYSLPPCCSRPDRAAPAQHQAMPHHVALSCLCSGSPSTAQATPPCCPSCLPARAAPRTAPGYAQPFQSELPRRSSPKHAALTGCLKPCCLCLGSHIAQAQHQVMPNHAALEPPLHGSPGTPGLCAPPCCPRACPASSTSTAPGLCIQ